MELFPETKSRSTRSRLASCYVEQTSSALAGLPSGLVQLNCLHYVRADIVVTALADVSIVSAQKREGKNGRENGRKECGAVTS